MKKRITIAVTSLGMLWGGYGAAAQEANAGGAEGQQRPRIAQMLQKADTNHDGKVTYDELKAVAPRLTQERFKKMDRNGDGVLSKEDRMQGQGQGAGQGGRFAELLKRADTNHDGKVTYDELRAVAPKMTQERFNMLDTNHDGVITSEDKPAAGAGGNRAEMLKRADTNHDGKITFDELKSVLPKLTQERFDAMDTNHDGVLTPEDRAQRKAEAGAQKQGATGAAADEIHKLLETDSNHDGKVSYEEVVAAKPGFPKETFTRYDTNGDGALSAADIKAGK